MSVTPSTVDSLFESAGELLLVCEDALADTAGGTPERSYVAPADPAFDCCPFLSVYVPGLSEDTTAVGPGGVAGGHRSVSGSIILATYVVHAIRCAPEGANGLIPSPVEIERVAQLVQQDGWALWNRLRSAIRCEEIFGNCREVYFDGGSFVPEQGGCVGWTFTIRASLPGIPRSCDDPAPVLTFEDSFSVDGALAAPYLDVSLEMGFDPGLVAPEVSGGLLMGVEPESAAMLLEGVEADTVWVEIGPTMPNQILLMLLPPGDLTGGHVLTVFPGSYNYETGPGYPQWMTGNFADTLAQGDRVAFRVRAGVVSVSVGNGSWTEVESVADPLGVSPLTPAIQLQGGAGSITYLAADSGELP